MILYIQNENFKKYFVIFVVIDFFKGFLDSIKRGQEQVLGDLSMTLCDPYAINFLALSATKILQHLINNESMPRVSVFNFIYKFYI